MNSEQACQRGQAMSRPKKKDQRQGQGTGCLFQKALLYPLLLEMFQKERRRGRNRHGKKRGMYAASHIPLVNDKQPAPFIGYR
jgi:hypothetical protein